MEGRRLESCWWAAVESTHPLLIVEPARDGFSLNDQRAGLGKQLVTGVHESGESRGSRSTVVVRGDPGERRSGRGVAHVVENDPSRLAPPDAVVTGRDALDPDLVGGCLGNAVSPRGPPDVLEPSVAIAAHDDDLRGEPLRFVTAVECNGSTAERVDRRRGGGLRRRRVNPFGRVRQGRKRGGLGAQRHRHVDRLKVRHRDRCRAEFQLCGTRRRTECGHRNRGQSRRGSPTHPRLHWLFPSSAAYTDRRKQYHCSLMSTISGAELNPRIAQLAGAKNP